MHRAAPKYLKRPTARGQPSRALQTRWALHVSLPPHTHTHSLYRRPPVCRRSLRVRRAPPLAARRRLLHELLALRDLGRGGLEGGLDGEVLLLQRGVLRLDLAQRLLERELVLTLGGQRRPP